MATISMIDKKEIRSLLNKNNGDKDFNNKVGLTPNGVDMLLSLIDDDVTGKAENWQKFWQDENRVFMQLRKSPYIKWDSINSFTFLWDVLVDKLHLKVENRPVWTLGE